MGGRGSSSGGLGNGRVERVNIVKEDDLVVMRGEKQTEVDDVLTVAERIEREFGYTIEELVVATIKGDSNTMAYYEENTQILAINSKYFEADKMEEAYERCAKAGFHPAKGDKTGLEATTAHEFGHALTEAIAKKRGVSFDKAAEDLVVRSLKTRGKTDAEKKAGMISGYAKQSNAECVAEAFADVYCNGNKATKNSRSIVDAITQSLRDDIDYWANYK